MSTPTSKDPVIVFASDEQTLVFDNLKDVREAERLIRESDKIANDILNGDRGDAAMRSAGEYSRKLHAEIERHRARAQAYSGEHGEPKPGSIPARLLKSSADCCEQMLDAVTGLDYILATKGRGPGIAEAARLN